MRYRRLRKVATGEWTDALFTTDGEFNTTELTHRTEIAHLGLAVDELESVERETAASAEELQALLLAESGLIPVPPDATPATPASISHDRRVQLLQINRSEWTTAQLRELLELTAWDTLT